MRRLRRGVRRRTSFARRRRRGRRASSRRRSRGSRGVYTRPEARRWANPPRFAPPCPGASSRRAGWGCRDPSLARSRPRRARAVSGPCTPRGTPPCTCAPCRTPPSVRRAARRASATRHARPTAKTSASIRRRTRRTAPRRRGTPRRGPPGADPRARARGTRSTCGRGGRRWRRRAGGRRRWRRRAGLSPAPPRRRSDPRRRRDSPRGCQPRGGGASESRGRPADRPGIRSAPVSASAGRPFASRGRGRLRYGSARPGQAGNGSGGMRGWRARVRKSRGRRGGRGRAYRA